MQNIVQKHIVETPEVEDEGVVAIEYVLIAVAAAAGVTLVFTTGLWPALQAKLNGLFG